MTMPGPTSPARFLSPSGFGSGKSAVPHGGIPRAVAVAESLAADTDIDAET
jgi:hypothetical protein